MEEIGILDLHRHWRRDSLALIEHQPVEVECGQPSPSFLFLSLAFRIRTFPAWP